MSRLLRFVPFLFLLAGAVLLLPSRGQSLPLYAARTGLQCQTCHFDPNGGGGRNEFGFNFAKNRHAIEPEADGEFKDLALRNRVADDFPLYFGLNQRFMLLTDHQEVGSWPDASGFFNMESGLHLTFQPTARLTMSYSNLTGPNGVASTRDAWGMIGFGPHYLRAGQFRVPFGLRMDDHTVATRNSFLDYQSGQRFLPYDPHQSDRGVEFGAAHGNFFGRTSWTNGTSALGGNPPTAGRHPQAIAAKFGYAMPQWQGGASFYDEWHPSGGQGVRSTRWGYYGLTHYKQFAFLGEVAAGTDRNENSGDPIVKNLLAYWAEADWSPRREYNLRVRYDHVALNRSSDDAIRDANSYNRWALEGEYQPLPFAEIRWTLRLIDPVLAKDESDTEIPNEKQAYVQFHFTY
ncbi:MAG: hypothetical protein U0704_11055 [Candidatus Eisenbacteria bacterium]